ncbi:M48 family metallopeptidase [Anaerosinus massiliensis]|uniref:M48 family metallopeptidase n=1 Tax=Massilibacillus massiliensis TaxID=1806837 RepID=UPI000DA63DE2|nr:M48 family metallopeptidase [Massilibacillus massiliensis]
MESLINSKEKFYFILSLVISIVLYLLMVVSIVGIIYLLIGIMISFIVHGLFIGNLRGNGIKISETQFPEVYHLSKEIANKMGMDAAPDIYIIQSNGMLNAFATKFLGRSFVVLYSDIFELAYKQGEAELAFIICHEFAHLKRKHVSRRTILLPSMVIPFLSQSYSRACEYTCDSFAAHYQPNGAENGLLILAVGKQLYQKVNIQEYINQRQKNSGFWVRLSELLSTHPDLPKRIQNIQRHIKGKMTLESNSVDSNTSSSASSLSS